VFLTSNFELAPQVIADLYKSRRGILFVIQMDKTAFANQGFLWHLTKHRQNANLDIYLGEYFLQA